MEYFLFPFEHIKKKSKVIIYGLGNAGQQFLQQIMLTRYCEVVLCVDQAYHLYYDLLKPVYEPNRILTVEFDYIIISIQDENIAEMIIKKLILEFKVDKKKIIYSKRRGLNIHVKKRNKIILGLDRAAYNYDNLSIAFVSYGGGLGDAIISRKVYDELVKKFPDCKIDIYAYEKNKEYMKSFYGRDNHLNAIFDFDEYFNQIENYELSLRVWHCINIDYYNQYYTGQYSDELTRLAKNIFLYNNQYKNADYNMILRNIMSSRIMGANRYTCLSSGGALDILDQKVEIYSCHKQEFYELKLGNYITFNYGSGGDVKKHQVKEWPNKYISKYIIMLKHRFPEIQVIQIGSSHSQKITEADQYFLGRDLELVKYILKNSILHVDCEGGLVHLATQLGTKCAVIFGPTDVHYYGYKQNINIVSRECEPCIGLWKDAYTCLRGFKYPPCMYSITPRTVFRITAKYIKKRLEISN